MDQPLPRKLAAELLGSLLLAALVIGSGIAAQRLSPGDTGLQLTENAAATAAGLFALILMFGPISGAHFNPRRVLRRRRLRRAVVAARPRLPARPSRRLRRRRGPGEPDVLSISTTHRATAAHGLSEVVATVGLILMIFSLVRSGRAERAPAAVGAYIGAAYWFTSSTSFANPAITIGRMFSDTFAGIAPASVPLFLGAQVVGGGLALLLVRTLYPGVTAAQAVDVVLPHPAASASR